MTNDSQHGVAEVREIVSSRLLEHPRSLVFQAFSDAELLARWWGPKGFSNTFIEFDPRPGGVWQLVMHGPDGGDYSLTKEFIEYQSPERIVLRHHDDMHGFVMTMDFEEDDGGTRLTWRMRFDTNEEAARVRTAVLEANEENFDRLEALLG